MADFDLRSARRSVFEAHLRPSEKLVLLALLDHWSKKYPKPRPGLTRLSLWTGLTRPTLIATLAELVRIGALPEPETGPRGAHTFDLSALVRNLDQWRAVRPVRLSDQSREPAPVLKLDQSTSGTGKKTAAQLVKKPRSTGKAETRIEHQNGSRSSEESKKKALEESTPCASQATTPGEPLRLIASEPEQPAATVELWQHYDVEHLRLRKAKPVFTERQRGRAAKAFQDLDEALKGDRLSAKNAITRALAKGFHVQPWKILEALNTYIGEDAQPGARQSGPKQPNSGYRPPVAREGEF